MTKLDGKHAFPCPLCKNPLEVRESKKSKPYVVCDSCGVQMFVRNKAGIATFRQLVAEAGAGDLWAELAKLRTRYYKTCPQCGAKFWVSVKLIETSLFDGSLEGFRCPSEDCGEVIPWREEDET